MFKNKKLLIKIWNLLKSKSIIFISNKPIITLLLLNIIIILIIKMMLIQEIYAVKKVYETIYNILVSWIPNHPFLTIGILGSSFFLGIFIFRRVGGSASSSAVSTVVNVGLPTTLTTTTNQLGFNLLTMQQYIQNMYNNVNNLGTFGGVLFIIRRVFRR